MSPVDLGLSKAELVQRIRSILANKNLTISQVSQRSGLLYGRSSAYFIPHNFLYEIRRPTFSPSIYQFAALTRISGFRLSHWLRLFGFDPEEIARLQVYLPAKRTILLDSSWADPNTQVRFLRDKELQVAVPDIAPLSQFLEFELFRPLSQIYGRTSRKFLYAKVGQQDALAFPELLPGSIVRVNSEIDFSDSLSTNPTQSGRLYLIAHSRGLFCCRLQMVSKNVIAPVSSKLPFGQVELQYPTEINVLGAVDLEIRPAARFLRSDVPADLAKLWTPYPLEPEPRLGRRLRNCRSALNFSLQAVSAASRQIAKRLRDQGYFISPSTLSDYETSDTAPRHVHKIITLCAIYGLGFRDFLQTSGISEGEDATEPIPTALISIPSEPKWGGNGPEGAGLLAELLRKSVEVPLFLRNSIADLSGLAAPSLQDFFWVGGDEDPLHPYLKHGLVVALNRRRKKPLHDRSKPLWEQPVYLLLLRDGEYLCGCCSVENGNLVIHPYPQQFHRSLQFRNHKDAEIIGQITAIARRIL